MPHRWAVSAVVASLALAPTRASAFVLKHAENGAPVRWRSETISFVIHRSLDAAPGASAAARAAAAAWSRQAGAPQASAAAGEAAAAPVVDGKNVILRSASFAPVGSALAVTVLSFDERTGDVVDADIVLNAKHDLEALPRRATTKTSAKGAGAGSKADEDEHEATPGASRPKDAHSLPMDAARYDVAWVLAHEVGHAMGLGDDPDAPAALMYPYVAPDLAGPAAPTSADLDGIESLYGSGLEGGEGGPPSAGAAPGCTGAAVAGAGPWQGARGPTARRAGAVLAVVGAITLARRHRRAAAALGIAALLALAPSATTLSSSSHGAARGADVEAEVLARVVGARATVGDDGILRTDVRLVVTEGSTTVMPATILRAAVPGGSYGGIRQEIGHVVAPRAGDDVRVALRGAAALPPDHLLRPGSLPGSATRDIVVRTKRR
jgi:hypothetical protein